MIYTLSRGAINPGLSAAEENRRRQISRIRTHIEGRRDNDGAIKDGSRSLVTANQKGGIGKTTVTACTALTLAEYRGDRMIAVDANPDAGTLADRLTGHCGVTARDLLDNITSIRSWTDMSHYTSLIGRLQVLASEQDPARSEAFNRDEYDAIMSILGRYYITLTDSGTGLVHSAMTGTLGSADALILAAAPTVDGTSRSATTLDWLASRGYGELVEQAVVAISCDRSSRYVDRPGIVNYFRSRCRAVVEIPADPHLAIGGPISLDELKPATRDAFLELAAAVADSFAWAPPVHRDPAVARAAARRSASPMGRGRS